jgi:hypothetical protein
LLSLVLALAGCGDSNSMPSAGGSGGNPGSSGAAGAAGDDGSGGVGGKVGTPALSPLTATPRYAVVSTDYSSASIALLDEEFEIISDSWLSSGTTYPGLVATLSGDVSLPTRQESADSFTVIDRFLTDVVSQFFVPSGNLNGQRRTHGEANGSGFSSNPQDVIFVGAHSAWVPRYETNLDPDAPAENKGNDLYEIDPSDMSATGERIDLSSLNTSELVEMPSGATEVEVFARPSRGVRVDSTLVVGLDRISSAFDAAGSGMVALVDLDTHSVKGVELPGLKSCGRLVPIPGVADKVAVACTGFSRPFGDEAQIRASSGIAILSVGEGDASVDRMWRVSDDSESAIAVGAMIALDETRVLAVAAGNFVDIHDTLYLVDLLSGDQTPVHTSDGSFTIGVSAYDPDSEMLYVPDAASSSVVELARDGDDFDEVGSTPIAPGLGLPPAQVHLLD